MSSRKFIIFGAQDRSHAGLSEFPEKPYSRYFLALRILQSKPLGPPFKGCSDEECGKGALAQVACTKAQQNRI